MNDKKICFIMCTNNQTYCRESVSYIRQLHIPDGYSIDVITVTDAPSMTAGYNEAMRSSDAKYKIYIHQDVMIIDPDFLLYILHIFTDNSKIGMIGMIGAPKLAENKIMWYSNRIGQIYANDLYHTYTLKFDPPSCPYQKVEAIDGLLIATQYDLPWRDDLFQGWDFYDVSQSTQFRLHGYDVVVPYMDPPWVIHDDGIMDLTNYYKAREIYVKNYTDLPLPEVR